MKTTVLIPTYRRPQDLRRCLEALQRQQRLPDEVLVVLRNSDQATWDLLNQNSFAPLPLRTQVVEQVGQVAALNAGLDVATGDIIAITDDDTAPRSHWLSRIESHFLADQEVGGVGGRDWIYYGGTHREEGTSPVVGKIQWFGRLVGRHNLGVGDCREVEVLKGANMSYRRAAIRNIRFDERLLGTGAQAHNDLAFSLSIRRAGWKLIYDPGVEVDHHIGQRFDDDQRDQFHATAFFNSVHNETLTLLEYLPLWRRWIFLIWALLIGTRKGFGLVQWLRFLPYEKMLACHKWWISMRGRWAGWQTWRKTKHIHSADWLSDTSASNGGNT